MCGGERDKANIGNLWGHTPADRGASPGEPQSRERGAPRGATPELLVPAGHGQPLFLGPAQGPGSDAPLHGLH